MKAPALAAFAGMVGVRVATISTVIVNRFDGDQVRIPARDISKLSDHGVRLALRMIHDMGAARGAV